MLSLDIKATDIIVPEMWTDGADNSGKRVSTNSRLRHNAGAFPIVDIIKRSHGHIAEIK